MKQKHMSSPLSTTVDWCIFIHKFTTTSKPKTTYSTYVIIFIKIYDKVILPCTAVVYCDPAKHQQNNLYESIHSKPERCISSTAKPKQS